MFSDASSSNSFPAFKTLWENYPHKIDGYNQRPSSNASYRNQCAIRLSVAFQKSGMDMSNYPESDKSIENYALTANRLKFWINQNYGEPSIKLTQEEFHNSAYYNKHGIIYLDSPNGYANHIDLYQGDFNYAPYSRTGSGYYKADMIWFWEIK